jgi:hypothetical protein
VLSAPGGAEAPVSVATSAFRPATVAAGSAGKPSVAEDRSKHVPADLLVGRVSGDDGLHRCDSVQTGRLLVGGLRHPDKPRSTARPSRRRNGPWFAG